MTEAFRNAMLTEGAALITHIALFDGASELTGGSYARKAVTWAAVRKYQTDNGMAVTGEWTDTEQAKYNALAVKPPESVDRQALLLELRGILDRAAAITKLL